MKELTVNVPAVDSGSYTIKIGSGILPQLWDDIENQLGAVSKLVVTDSNVVAAGHLETLIGDRQVETFIIDPPGEQSKRIDVVVRMIEQMESAVMGRDSAIIAIGGGTVGDMAGFAASIFKRGIPVVHIPTTTVSQADSSIGGKTGVDSSMSKNAFGAFWHPSAVYIDTNTLLTLDQRQYTAGLLESVKHALIASCDYFEFIESNIDAILDRDSSALENLAQYNCKIKAEVVEADPTEKNQRRILNYGHTIGHAVESASDYSLLHGECVGIGMVAAGLIEIELGIGSTDRLERVINVLKKLGCPVTIPADITDDVILELIRRDKKAVGSWPRFALVEEIGKPCIKDGQWAHNAPKDIIKTALMKLR